MAVNFRLVRMNKASLFVLGLSLSLISYVMSHHSAIVQASTGLIIKPSPYSIEKTESRFLQILKSKGITVFASIDHAQNAANVNLELQPTRVVLFGNPKVGTLLMQCQQSIGIDLPQKLLIFENEKGVQIAYEDPHRLSERHQLGDCGVQVISNVAETLNGLTDQVIAP